MSRKTYVRLFEKKDNHLLFVDTILLDFYFTIVCRLKEEYLCKIKKTMSIISM